MAFLAVLGGPEERLRAEVALAAQLLHLRSLGVGDDLAAGETVTGVTDARGKGRAGAVLLQRACVRHRQHGDVEGDGLELIEVAGEGPLLVEGVRTTLQLVKVAGECLQLVE